MVRYEGGRRVIDDIEVGYGEMVVFFMEIGSKGMGVEGNILWIFVLRCRIGIWNGVIVWVRLEIIDFIIVFSNSEIWIYK